MRDALLAGIGRFVLPVPSFVWRRQVAKTAARVTAALRFMTPEHHRVRDFVVAELPRAAAPLAPATIAARVGLDERRVVAILDELERRLMFLYRDAAGRVEWAYPVTAARTPHQLKLLPGGETLYAA